MVGLHHYLKGDASTPVAPKTNEDWGVLSPGPYVGIVKANHDPLRAGRLKVFIPSLKGNISTDFDGLIDCDYLSPFYGNKGLRHVKPGFKHTDSQFSYGFWAVPPDLETRVLVIFAEGKMEEAFWIGCVQEPLTNHMTPGIASSDKVKDELNQSTLEEYGSTNLPAGEVNRYADVDDKNYDTKNKPVHPLADTLMTQGLSADNIRGNTTSSAQRESPSQVFGLSTPGRLNPGATPTRVGANDSEEEVIVDRLSGHTFVMDDGAEDGTNQLTRLRTSSGHQLLMHDTEGIVYIANGTGNAWIEMNRDGRIDVYSGVGGINMRTHGDFNLHSDSNINMHAGGQVRIASEGEMIHSSSTFMMNIGEKGIFNSSQKGRIGTYALEGITSYTEGQVLVGAGGQIHLAGAQVHFNSTKADSTWGPKWLDTEAASITTREEGDVELIKKGIEPLKPFTKKTNTTVHRFITHEPVLRLAGFSTDGALPSFDETDDQMDTKQWSRLANTPGTVEYTEQRNRLSTKESIRDGQAQADLQALLKREMGTSTSGPEARKILKRVAKVYDKKFNVVSMSKGKWDISKSISSKLGEFNISDKVSDVVNNSTKKLADQVIDNISGSAAVAMFKDNVFVNEAGQLFALGGSLHGADFSKLANLDVKGFAGDLKNVAMDNATMALSNAAVGAFKKNVIGNLTKKAIGVDKFGNTIYKRLSLPTSIAGIDISGIAGNINLASLASIGDLKATTNVFKSVIAGQVTNAVTQTAVSAIKSQATSFLTGVLGKSTARELAISGGRNVASSLGLKIGSTALPQFLGGSFTGMFSAIGSWFTSDVRLKEDIQLIGKSPSGINIYSFKYKQLSGTYIGVMAQEVPWARQMTDTGYYAVDYNKVDVKFRRLH